VTDCITSNRPDQCLISVFSRYETKKSQTALRSAARRRDHDQPCGSNSRQLVGRGSREECVVVAGGRAGRRNENQNYLLRPFIRLLSTIATSQRYMRAASFILVNWPLIINKGPTIAP
jgi:hypothetical protein